MSFLSDVLAFENFNLKDMWGKVKDDPLRMLVGAGDPFSTSVWNKALGKDWEPLVDQFGGAYGGSPVSAFGDTQGGVYQRARDEGIDTGPGGSVHDLAHVISMIYAGNYGKGKLGGSSGGDQFSGIPKSTPNASRNKQQPNFIQMELLRLEQEREEERRKEKEREFIEFWKNALRKKRASV